MYMKDEKGKGASFHCDWSRWIQIAVDGAVELLIAPGTELKGEHTGRFIFDEYRKIANSNTSRSDAHVGFFMTQSESCNFLNIKRHNLAKYSRMYDCTRESFEGLERTFNDVRYPSSRENWSAWVSNLTISIAKTSSKFHKILKWLRLLRRISFWKFHTWKIQAKLLQRSPVVGDFYGTGIEIWAGFGRLALM